MLLVCYPVHQPVPSVMRCDHSPASSCLRVWFAETGKRVALNVTNERNDLCVSLAVDGCPVCEVGECFENC